MTEVDGAGELETVIGACNQIGSDMSYSVILPMLE